MTAIEFQHKLINLQGSLMGYAYSLTVNKDEAKDLVQETFLKALKSRDKFVYESNFRAWTFRIMKNSFINNYRSSFRKNNYQNRTEALLIDRIKSSGSDNPDSIYSASEMTQNIELLQEQFRILFKMHLSGYKYKEISEGLKLKIGTVKSRIFFAKKNLIRQLES
jgi:RNA polymerase sigma factor (sigma-70 family)